MLNGQIDFVSREGVGTAFDIRFPVVLEQTQ
jgi:signal transduction histidine kinase